MATVKLVTYEHASTSCRVSRGRDALPVLPYVLINEVFLVEGVLLVILMVLCLLINSFSRGQPRSYILCFQDGFHFFALRCLFCLQTVLLGSSTSQSHDTFPNLTRPLGCLKCDPILTSRETLGVAIPCFVNITISAPIVEILTNQASSTSAFSWENI